MHNFWANNWTAPPPPLRIGWGVRVVLKVLKVNQQLGIIYLGGVLLLITLILPHTQTHTHQRYFLTKLKGRLQNQHWSIL